MGLHCRPSRIFDTSLYCVYIQEGYAMNSHYLVSFIIKYYVASMGQILQSPELKYKVYDIRDHIVFIFPLIRKFTSSKYLGNSQPTYN